jgi:hypothetical protein
MTESVTIAHVLVLLCNVAECLGALGIVVGLVGLVRSDRW